MAGAYSPFLFVYSHHQPKSSLPCVDYIRQLKLSGLVIPLQMIIRYFQTPVKCVCPVIARRQDWQQLKTTQNKIHAVLFHLITVREDGDLFLKKYKMLGKA